jgi:transposase-like protein
MKRRKFTREFKVEAVKLVRERGVATAQAARDLGIPPNVLWDWLKSCAADPGQAFAGHGQMKPEQLEIAQLKREVLRLKAERDIHKKPRPTLRRSRREVRLHCKAPGDLADGMVVRALGVSRGGFYGWLTRPRSQRSRSDEDVGAKVRASFLASDRTYGARRV